MNVYKLRYKGGIREWGRIAVKLCVAVHARFIASHICRKSISESDFSEQSASG